MQWWKRDDWFAFFLIMIEMVVIGKSMKFWNMKQWVKVASAEVSKEDQCQQPQTFLFSCVSIFILLINIEFWKYFNWKITKIKKIYKCRFVAGLWVAFGPGLIPEPVLIIYIKFYFRPKFSLIIIRINFTCADEFYMEWSGELLKYYVI